MAEILAYGNIYDAFDTIGISASQTYKGESHPFISVWELSKEDLRKLESFTGWNDEWGWYKHSKGARLGSPCEILTVNGQMIVGWDAANKQAEFDSLLDYAYDGLCAQGWDDYCDYVVELARVNGMTLSKLFKKYN